MSDWKARRFWTQAEVVAGEAGWAIRLDGRVVRTPLKSEVAMPSRALADGVAAEWQAQGDVVAPLTMPLTRAVNATLDKVIPQRAEVAANLADYGGSDLLCYRAVEPADLIARQAGAWNPMLDWAEARFGSRLAVTQGVVPVPQPVDAMAVFRAHVDGLSPWELTAISEFVTLTGSLVLGLAVMEDHGPETVWPLARIDEDWQAERWGADEEEAERIAGKRDAFLQAHRYLELLRSG